MKEHIKRIIIDTETYTIAIISAVLLTALVCLDYSDVISKYIAHHDSAIGLIIVIGIIVIGVLFLLRNHFWDLAIKIPIANSLDRALFVLLIGVVVYYFSLIIINQAYTYKCILLGSLFIISLSVIVSRAIRYCSLIKHSELSEKAVYDFKQLVEGISEDDRECPILVSEREVDYDLFGREEIIFQLSLALELCCKSDLPFVIGLSGEWGSGKTTILNIVKKSFSDNERIVIIDSFDPWIYSSQKAMLAGMYYTILHETGVHFNNLQINELIGTVCEIVEESAKVEKIGKIARTILLQNDGENSIDLLKKQIDDYLRTQNKTIVFFIDNLDRATADNVRFVFKLVGAVFDFERVKYVLSYDKNRLSDIFEDSLKIDSHYVEKIINQELIVPKISEDYRRIVFERCINNLLLSNGIPQNQLSDYKGIVQFIINEVHDVRIFKRLLNSAFFITFSNIYLYKPDLLTIEIIRFLDFELYNSIYQNRQYFIDSDRHYDRMVLWGSGTEVFNEKCKSYYEGLFKGRENYKGILADSFPYVYNYINRMQIKQDGYSDTERYKKTQLLSRINSAKYFDLYFSYALNDFLDINIQFEEGLSQVVQSAPEEIESKFTNLLSSVPIEAQLEWMQKLYLFKDEIVAPAIFPILVALYKNIKAIDDERGFLMPSPRDRAIGVMADLFSRITEQDSFVSIMNREIGKLFVVTRMISWLDKNDNDAAKEKLFEYAKSVCDDILKNGIDIYGDNCYSEGNVWSIYHILEYNGIENRENIVKPFIAKIVSSKNIYRLLRDTVGCSIGRQYGYRITKSNYEALIDESVNIQELLNEHLPDNPSEQLIYDLYQDFREHGESFDREREYPSPFVFDL